MSEPLVCPSCARTFPLDERFCPDCQMPLTYAGLRAEEPITKAHERARKIKPQYAEGDLVRVAGARQQPEAEMIQGMLLEEGIPSVLRRAIGFDVPDFLAAGPRDVMVPQSGAMAAREVLLEADMAPPQGSPGSGAAPPWIVLALVLGLFVVLALGAWMLSR